jgi:hypothetical protein
MATMSPLIRPFKISVSIETGKVIVSPDPAVVDAGTSVEWRFEVDPGLPPSLTLEVYFSAASPTGWSSERAIYSKSRSPSPIIGAVAQQPGDYKYGVKASNHETNEVIADDDPYLVVRPRG